MRRLLSLMTRIWLSLSRLFDVNLDCLCEFYARKQIRNKLRGLFVRWHLFTGRLPDLF